MRIVGRGCGKKIELLRLAEILKASDLLKCLRASRRRFSFACRNLCPHHNQGVLNK